MFQFSRRFGFLSTFRLSNRTPKITNISAKCHQNRSLQFSAIQFQSLHVFWRHSVVGYLSSKTAQYADSTLNNDVISQLTSTILQNSDLNLIKSATAI